MSSLDRIKKKRQQLSMENSNTTNTDRSIGRINQLRDELSTTGKIDYGYIAPSKLDNFYSSEWRDKVYANSERDSLLTKQKELQEKLKNYDRKENPDRQWWEDDKNVFENLIMLPVKAFSPEFSKSKYLEDPEYDKLVKEYDVVNKAVEDNAVATKKYDDNVFGFVEKSLDVFTGNVQTGLKGVESTAKKILSGVFNKEVETDTDLTLNEKLSNKVMSEAEGVEKGYYDVVGSVGRMFPQMMMPSGKAATIMGFANYGGGAYNQAKREGYSEEDATKYGLAIGSLEMATTKALGSFSSIYGKTKLGNASQEVIDKVIPKIIKNKQVRNVLGQFVTEYGEEFLQQYIEGVTRDTLLDDKGFLKSIWENVSDPDMFADALYSGLIGGITGSTMAIPSQIDAYKYEKTTGRDAETGLTANEQKVVDSEVAKRTEGKNLTKKQIAEIETEVKNELEKGYISTDTIESVLGGDTYNSLKSTRDNKTKIENEIKELEGKKNAEITVKEMEHLKDLREQLKGIDTNTLETDLQGKMGQIIKSDDYLQRSYQEKAKRGQKFTYDASKVTNEFEKAVYESASKVMNNTNRSHEFVEKVAKISKDKGTRYEFTNNAELEKSNYDIKGRQVNGLVTVEENGNKKILINVDSAKALNTIVGHETTHLLEGTKEYQELQDAIFNHAKTKGDFEARQTNLTKLYKDIANVDINSELTADLVGDYLFTDNNFISELSTQKPTVFQKIKELIDDLVVRFKGTKEEKALREVQKKFKEAYRQSGTQTNTDTQYSMVGKKGVDRLAKNDSSYQSVIDNYNEALKMKEEGKTNRKIWQETLWIQDEEGNWKIELSDRDAILKIEPEKNKKYKLKDVLNHEKLYEIYPETKNITVKFRNIKDNVDPDTGKHRMIAGYYNSFTGTISVNNKLLEMTNGDKHIINTILHEVQHKIQKYEGFNYGYKGSDEAGYFNNLGEREAKDTERRRNLSYKERMQIAPVSLFEENSNSLYNNANGGNRSEVNQKNKTILSKALYDANERSFSDRRGSRANVQEIENPYYIDEELDNSSFFNTQYSLSDADLKQKQLDIILKENPMTDDYHTGIRTIEDIKTFDETINDDESFVWGDFSQEDAKKALEKGEITVYSSYPIEQGVFVSTSKNQAQDYAGSGKIYSKTVPLNEVAWINGDEGQYAKVEDADIRYSLSESVPLENRVSGDELLDAQDLIDEIKSVGGEVDKNGYVTVYHQTTDENAQKIKETGKMISKELDIFFSTSKDAQQSEGKGQTKLAFKIPAEKLVLDDIFSDNADVKISLNGEKSIDVSDYLIDTDADYSLSNQNEIAPRNPNLTYGEDVKYQEAIAPLQEEIQTLTETVNELKEQLAPIVEAPVENVDNPVESASNTKLSEDITPIKEQVAQQPVEENQNLTIKESNALKLSNLEQSLQKYGQDAEQSLKAYDDLIEGTQKKYDSDAQQMVESYNKSIDEKRTEYDSLKNKNTQKANNLLQQIARIETQREKVLNQYKEKRDNEINRLTAQRDNMQVEYERKMNNVQKRIDKMNSKDFKTAEQRITKQDEYRQQARELIGDTSTWKDKKMGIQYQIHTFKRNLRDIVRGVDGKADLLKADAIYEEYEGKYDKNEAKLKVEYNRIMNPYAELDLTEQEHVYTQMLGEFKYNPDTTLTKEQVDGYYNKYNSKIDVDKVNNAIESARKTYDELFNRINERLKEQGMKELEYRRGYFPHFIEEKQGLLAKIFDWKIHKDDIPTDIAGLTELNNPERSWQTFNKHRESDITDYNFGKGLETYVRGALDWIYHIEDIQKRRALENEIRYQHSEKGVQEQIEAIYTDTELDTDQIQERIDSIYKNAQNPLNNFVTDFRNATNRLANKKSTMDRSLEYATNRRIYSTMTNLSNRVSGNMIGGSISSALTNFIPITQSWGEVKVTSSLKAARETIKNAVIDDGTIAKSTFLTNRLVKNENLYKTGWDKVQDKIAIMTDVIDSFTSQTVWRSKYNENIANGMSETEAIANADNFAKNVIAGRSRGNEPTIFHSKNPFTKMFTAFQVEVSNQYDYMFKDMPKDIENQSKAKLIKGYATMFVGAYLYNALYSSLVGRDVAFDPIGIVEDILKELGFGDDEEEEEKTASEKFTAITEDLVQQLPFVGGLFGGGRMPISAAIPYDNPIEMVKGTATDLLDALDEGKRERAVKDLWSEWQKPISYLALPVGGGQLTKTIQGLSMYDDDLPVAGSYTNSGDLRFTADESLGGMIKSALFGRWASDSAQEYVDSGFKTVKKSNIDEMVDLDMSSTEYRKYRNGLNKAGSTNEEKINYINSLDVSDEHKNIMANNVLKRDYDVDMSDYGEMSGYDEFDYSYKNPDKYKVITQIDTFDNFNSYKDDIADIKEQFSEDNGYSTKDRKAAVQQYINSLSLDIPQKIMLEKMAGGYSIKDYENYMFNYIQSLPMTAEEKQAIHKQLFD